MAKDGVLKVPRKVRAYRYKANHLLVFFFKPYSDGRGQP